MGNAIGIEWERLDVQEGVVEPRTSYEVSDRRRITELSAEDKAERDFLLGQLVRVEMINAQFGRGLENYHRRTTELEKVRNESKAWYKGEKVAPKQLETAAHYNLQDRIESHLGIIEECANRRSK